MFKYRIICDTRGTEYVNAKMKWLLRTLGESDNFALSSYNRTKGRNFNGTFIEETRRAIIDIFRLLRGQSNRGECPTFKCCCILSPMRSLFFEEAQDIYPNLDGHSGG